MKAIPPMRKARFAELVGISRQLVGHHARGVLAEALTEDGDIVVDHPASVAFLASRDLTPASLMERDAGIRPAKTGRPARVPTTALPRTATATSEPTSAIPFSEPPNIDEIRQLTYDQIVDRYGHFEGFGDWVELRKKVTETRRIELQNLETEGRLIPREPVKAHVFGAIDSAFRRLLQDAPKTIARRLYAAAKSNLPIEDAEITVREIVSSILRPVKATAVRVLRDGEPAKKEVP